MVTKRKYTGEIKRKDGGKKKKNGWECEIQIKKINRREARVERERIIEEERCADPLRGDRLIEAKVKYQRSSLRVSGISPVSIVLNWNHLQHFLYLISDNQTSDLPHWHWNQ